MKTNNKTNVVMVGNPESKKTRAKSEENVW